MPPGLMKATTAWPVLAPLVAASCASAITSPSADSPAALLIRLMACVMVPMTRALGTADKLS